MAKDPAFLFYPGDWQLGTLHMTLLEKGCYIELLILQFAKGKFTEAQAKHMLNGSFDLAWATLKEKFKTDGQFFWNERLRLEKEKRQKFTDSRKSNGSIKKDAAHMPKHMEDENENKDEIKNRSKGKNLGKSENPIVPRLHQIWTDNFPSYTSEIEFDYPALRNIADFIFRQAGLKNVWGNKEHETTCANTFLQVVEQIKLDQFWTNKPLQSIAKNIQEFYNKIKNPINGNGKGNTTKVTGEQLNSSFTKFYQQGK